MQAPQAAPYGQQVPYGQPGPYGQPQWGQPPVPEEPKRSTVGLIGVILAVVGLGLAFLGIFAFTSWFFTIPALVLAIIGLARKRDRNLLPVIALVTSIVAMVVSIVVFVDSAEDEFGDFFDSTLFSGGPAGATGPDGEPGLGSVEDPIAAGTPFSYDSAWIGEDATVWEVTVDGYMPLPESTWTGPGRCIAVVGGVTPTYVPEGQRTSSLIDTPNAYAIVDGEVYEGNQNCDTGELDALGYGHLWSAEVPENTLYLYYYDIWIPEDVTGDIQALVIGDPSLDGSVYVEAAELPYVGADPENSLDGAAGASAPDGLVLVSAGEAFSYESWWGVGEDAWEVVIDGYIDLPTLDGEDSGECKAIVGTITPTSIATGTVSDWAATPDLYLVAGGESHFGYANCDWTGTGLSGYESLWDAEVSVGTEYFFYDIVQVPVEVAADVEAIQVGDPDFDDVVTYVEALPIAP